MIQFKENLPIGSVIEARVTKKLEDIKLLILTFQGAINGRLHISQISNNREKSTQLFNMIKPGDYLDVCIIDYDEEKKCVHYSLKVFENQRKNIDNYKEAKAEIHQIYQREISLDKAVIARTRGTLDYLRGDLNQSAETAAFELIQNADDYPNPEFNNQVHLIFEVKDDFLLVKHNGLPFTKSNVHAITNLLTGDADKRESMEKTGYKGIGFKSVFKYSNWVYVRSGNYSFSFDKNKIGEKLQWEIIPNWVDDQQAFELVKDVEFFNKPVGFAIRANNKEAVEKIKGFLVNVFNDSKTMLFLKHINQLKYREGDNLQIVKRKQISESPKIIVLDNSTSHTSWMMFEKEYTISDEKVINDLADPNNSSIPPKFRHFRQPKIKFALPIDNKGNIASHGSSYDIFAYLPCRDENFGFPFLLNSDFIPDLSRNRINKNLELNKDILKRAGSYWAEIVADLAKDVTKLSKLHLLFPKLDTENELQAIFVEEFISNIQTLPLIPDKNLVLRKLDELVFEIIGISGIVDEVTLASLIPDDKFLVHTSINTHRLLPKLKQYEIETEIVDEERLKEALGSNTLDTFLKIPINNYKFLKFIVDKGLLEKYKEHKIVLNNEGNLVKVTQVYYTLGESKWYLEFLNLQYLSEAVKAIIDNSIAIDKQKLENVFEQFNPSDFIKNHKEWIDENAKIKLKDPTNNKSWFRFIFSYRGQLTDNIKAELRAYPVLDHQERMINSLAEDIYFYDEQLEYILNTVLPGNAARIISNSYCLSTSENEDWEAFWRNSFGIKKYTFVDFLKASVLDDIAALNKQIISNQNTALHFWWAIYAKSSELLEQKEILNALGGIYVKTKEGKLTRVNELYLTEEYDSSSNLEEVVDLLKIGGIEFISSEYLSEKTTASKWKSLLSQIGAKSELKELIITDVLPRINSFSDEDLNIIIPFLFNNIDVIEEQRKWNELLKLRLKTISGDYRSANEVIISSHYTGNHNWDSLLPSIFIPNLISSEYSDTNLLQWKNFFVKLGTKQIEDDKEVIALKIKHFNETQDSFNSQENAKVKHLKLFSELVELYKLEKLEKVHLQELIGINLLSKTNVFKSPFSLHFSSAYNPQVDLENLVSKPETLNVLAEDYISFNLKDVFPLLKKIGVSEGFEPKVYPTLSRATLKSHSIYSDYLNQIEKEQPYIPQNAIEYGKQHYISEFYTFRNLQFIDDLNVSKAFWQYVLEGKVKIPFGKTSTYKTAFNQFTVKNFAQFFISRNAVVPTLAGGLQLAKNLTSYNFKDLVSNEQLCLFDFRALEIDDNFNLEQWLGIKQKVDVEDLLNYIKSNKPSKEKFKGLINSLLNDYKLDDQASTLKIKNYCKEGFLLNTEGAWKPVKQLFVLDDSIKASIKRNEWIIDSLFKEKELRDKYFTTFGVRSLTLNEFKPDVLNQRVDNSFDQIVLQRLAFLAFAINNEEWKSLDNKYTEAFKIWKFYKCDKITLQFSEGVVDIFKDDERVLLQKESHTVSFVGNWRDQRNYKLIEYLLESLNIPKSKLQVVQNILLDDIEQVIEHFESGQFGLPEEIKRRFISEHFENSSAPILSESTKYTQTEGSPNSSMAQEVREETSTNTVYVDDEYKALFESIIKGRVDLDVLQQQGANREAVIKGVVYLESKGYSFEHTDILTGGGTIDNVEYEGKKYTLIIRSGKKGMLYLNQESWFKLKLDNYKLIVLVGNGVASSDFLLFNTQEELLQSKYNEFTLIRKPNTQVPEVVDNMLRDLKNKDKSHLLFVTSASMYNAMMDKVFSSGDNFPGNPNNAIGDNSILDFD
ncbi:sacsin N-terminal ATP-binding-like domain-containing protein [Pontibacter anaerobius]|uniref:S1 motif domain-containing protein n=1 Tax=Pontibacter anaerobius TaxID=2993940 RepID=A0ABT3RJU5_9BACT|nr:hypothetical protein [Pontibacter anaerobius]MCX2741460.1 hypothetical protein [Pontibacter anaerobius]